MYRAFALLTCLVCLFAVSAPAQVSPPEQGSNIPPDAIQNDKDGKFELKHAWIQKAQDAREKRDQYIEERGFYRRGMMPAAQRNALAVTGTFQVPVFCVKFSNTGADPYPTSTLQTRLFDGPFAPRTLHEFYNEISYGDLNVTGSVYGWTTLPNVDTYYAGAGTCNGLCGTSRVRELIVSTLTANDGAIDFGQYDNDGPDGLPNSGDDDGIVDFAAFVHSEPGEECVGQTGNIWSHRSHLTSWSPNTFFTTNDTRTGGGFIIVDDYVIQPAYNCDGVSPIDIGVFCHEFGHAFGLPDLYDTDGGSEGVGNWCLMGGGSWNTPENPAHMGAWAKNQLGWSDVTVVSGVPTPFSISNV